MSDETVVVELRVIDQLFRLSTSKDKQSELESVVNMLNQKFQDARYASPRTEHNKLVISVALALMQEIVTLNKSLQHYEQCHHVLRNILEEVESST
ncbi:cell division protein ZapA [Acinetobacter rathckeae]|uniref:cell division protein ZapA n=1 Tax=Acinetobacter rathckeae TaxID=2605272 RepID=UPI0018A2C528|nr:cell division protein ZapA [Acinetobacter rathckeae]MBF7686740.1 cell division protein ZapA [Acinetobacter rathckeae]MBF7695728.1 cell division protein ZapA [Acinetobacter rathckeae]